MPDESLSLARGAIAPWARTSATSPYYQQTLESLARAYREPMTKPWKDLPKAFREVILYGSGEDEITFTYDDGVRHYTTTKPFEGVINNIERRWRETESAWVTRGAVALPVGPALRRLQGLSPQAAGARGEDRRAAYRPGHGDVDPRRRRWFAALPAQLTPKQNEIAARILKEISERLTFLNDVGLDYLTLARAAGTLSGGESQRIRLASQIGSGLTGVLYVLDEPSIGLHQRDNARLLETLKSLRDIGNTVIVVEHDEEAILDADHVVDMGPGAGVHGGEVVAEGTPEQVMANPDSLTGQYLTGFKQIPSPKERRKPTKGRRLTVKGARANNLKNITVDIPLGLFTAVTGVSGGGKSTFLIETLYRAVARKLNGARELPGEHDAIEGLEQLDKVIDIDQSPIGRTPRSNPATYTGAFTPIREWFAELPEAKTRGYKPGRFSFNVKGGRCEACQGDGVIKIEMHFLPDIYVTCDVCKGKRYNRETLEIKFKGKSIADVLDMTVEEAAEFFKAVPPVRDKLETLARVGPRLYPCRPAGDHALGRRGAARQARQGAVEARHRPHALYPRRADHRPALPRCGEAARGAARAGRPGQHGGGHRAQSRSDQDRRLDRRPRPRRRRRRRRGGRHRHAGGDRRQQGELYRALSQAGAEAPPSSKAGGKRPAETQAAE